MIDDALFFFLPHKQKTEKTAFNFPSPPSHSDLLHLNTRVCFASRLVEVLNVSMFRPGRSVWRAVASWPGGGREASKMIYPDSQRRPDFELPKIAAKTQLAAPPGANLHSRLQKQ